MTLLLFCSC